MIGGWYRQDSDFVLLYRPTGHADPFVCAWLEFTAQASGSKHVTFSHGDLRTLIEPQSPRAVYEVSQCRCHKPVNGNGFIG